MLIIATGMLAPLAMALVLRGDTGWRPIMPVSLAAAVLFVVFLLLPWGNAPFLLAIVTLRLAHSGCRTPSDVQTRELTL